MLAPALRNRASLVFTGIAVLAVLAAFGLGLAPGADIVPSPIAHAVQAVGIVATVLGCVGLAQHSESQEPL